MHDVVLVVNTYTAPLRAALRRADILGLPLTKAGSKLLRPFTFVNQDFSPKPIYRVVQGFALNQGDPWRIQVALITQETRANDLGIGRFHAGSFHSVNKRSKIKPARLWS